MTMKVCKSPSRSCRYEVLDPFPMDFDCSATSRNDFLPYVQFIFMTFSQEDPEWYKGLQAIFEPTCAYAGWALMHCFPPVTGPKVT